MENKPRYVTWDVGAKALGVSKGVFFYEVSKGRVKEDLTRNEKDGRYEWESIQARKAQREARKPRRPYKRTEKVIIDWLEPSVIPALLAFNRDVYGPDLPLNEMVVYQERYKKNNRIAMAAFNYDRSICYGCIGLLPLSDQVCLEILAGQRS